MRRLAAGELVVADRARDLRHCRRCPQQARTARSCRSIETRHGAVACRRSLADGQPGSVRASLVMKKTTRPAASRSAPAPLDVEPRPFTLVGRTALVTGGSKGLGKAIAFALGQAGAKVAFNYANGQETAEATFAEFQGRGLEGLLVRADATNEKHVAKMCHAVENKLGPIDIVVVNATPAQPQKPFELYDWAFHQQMLDFFVKSPFLLTRCVLPGMKARRHGRIINIGSEVLRRGVPNFAPYVAAKGAQAGWTRSMASELGPWNITVNIVSPGWIPVERHQNDPAEQKNAYKALIPMRRWGVPADIGGVCTFLAGDAAAFVTGQDLAVNGGVTVC
jgi:3-oxoacyl-[acyl-carrier protein] reductase